MDQSTFNHGKSGDTNPKGRSRSPLLELYTRSLRNEREEKIGHRTSAACGGRLRLCYTLDEGKESERETTNCPPKRVRSNPGTLLAFPWILTIRGNHFHWDVARSSQVTAELIKAEGKVKRFTSPAKAKASE